MSVESKTTPERASLSFGPGILCQRYLTKELTTDEKIKQLIQENEWLREEIKALKGIIKNINN